LSHRSNYHLRGMAARGFTLVELIVVIVMIGIIVIPAYTFFNTSLSQYIALQAQGSAFTDLATQSQRLASVLRGATDIISATSEDIDCYAYFAPSDNYVSRIHYYKSADKTKLLADVTRMTSNPPQGTPIAASMTTHTIVNNYKEVAGVNLFAYLDASGNALPMPLTNLKSVKGIQVTLTAVGSTIKKVNSYQTVSLQVSMRNRKANL
jgi:prepilin-type N-terminal cleavage/methylation domain-containing protein